MQFRARLVIILLTISHPLVSFGIPTFFSEGFARLEAVATAGQEPVTADWIARQIDTRDTGRDSRLEMQMRLFDRQNRKRERTLTVIGLDGTANPASGGIADRTLVRFTYPNDIAGTSFLVWERPSGDDDRFLFLPALGRIRRISGAERQESFVGSDFTFEDIGGRALEDYSYSLLETEAAWLALTRPGTRRGGSSREPRTRRPRFPGSCPSCARTTSSSSKPISSTDGTSVRSRIASAASTASRESGRSST